MRTLNSIRNIITAWSGQLLLVLCQLVNRYAFVRTLGAEYLGLSSLFTNILSVLTLSEMGIGTALSFSLYLPLAKHDTEKIKSLMRTYKIAYRIIGCVVIGLGFAMLPVYPYFISSHPDIHQLDLIFLLFVANSGLSYFFSFKTSLLCCDQKNYIFLIIHYCSVFVLNIVQIVILYATRNYIIYVFTQLVFTLAQNVVVSIVADRLYPYLKEKDIAPLDSDERKLIKRNIGALFFHKMGDRVTSSIITVFISSFINLTVVGIYSNYKYISDSLSTIIFKAFSSMTGSVGNLEATETPDKIYLVFKRVFFMNFILIGFCSICLVCLFQHFVLLWVGQPYLMNNLIMVAFVIQFYVAGMRKTVLVFRDASASYYYDRYKPIVAMLYCFLVTYVLIKRMGVVGVLVAGITCNLFIDTLVESYVLYKHVFNTKLGWYCRRYLSYSIVTFFDGAVVYSLVNLIPGTGVIGFIVKLIVTVVLALIILLLSSCIFTEFRFWKNMLWKYVHYFFRMLAEKWFRRVDV